jgi:hypothetical protein
MQFIISTEQNKPLERLALLLSDPFYSERVGIKLIEAGPLRVLVDCETSRDSFLDVLMSSFGDPKFTISPA